jgi:hypothetical protein
VAEIVIVGGPAGAGDGTTGPVVTGGVGDAGVDGVLPEHAADALATETTRINTRRNRHHLLSSEAAS